jgi:methyltransferase, FkbM family
MIEDARTVLKSVLPLPVRTLVRGALTYFQRLGRWVVILWQVQGCGARDQLVLVASALAAPLVSLAKLREWQDPQLLFDASVHVRDIGRFSLRAKTDDLWHVLPWREQALLETIRSRLGSGDVFIDAGANIGVYTVLASRLVGPGGRVVAVEMMPDTADRLEDHIRTNGLQNVTVVRRALSDSSGRTITASVQPGKFGQATISVESKTYGRGVCVEVTSITLDEITAGAESIALMKMDLEGAEKKALEGAGSAIAKFKAIVYESWGWKRNSPDTPLDRLLVDAGFRLEQVEGNNILAFRPPT